MFESLNSLSVSGPGRGSGLRLEALEDRLTPGVLDTFNPFVPFAGGTVAVLPPFADPFSPFGNGAFALSGLILPASAVVDSAYLIEVARTSVVQWFIGTTEAAQGSNPQARAFGQQLANSQFNLFNQVFPVLTASGLPLVFTPIDRALVNALPTLSAADLDTQALFFSSVYALDATGLTQTELQLGIIPGVRSFAQLQTVPLQTQLQTTFGILGPNLTSTTLNIFSTVSGSGVFNVTGLVTPPFNPSQFNTFGGFSPFVTGFAPLPAGSTGF